MTCRWSVTFYAHKWRPSQGKSPFPANSGQDFPVKHHSFITYHLVRWTAYTIFCLNLDSSSVEIRTGSFNTPDVNSTDNNQPWRKACCGISTLVDPHLPGLMLNQYTTWLAALTVIALPLVCHWVSIHAVKLLFTSHRQYCLKPKYFNHFAVLSSSVSSTSGITAYPEY